MATVLRSNVMFLVCAIAAMLCVCQVRGTVLTGAAQDISRCTMPPRQLQIPVREFNFEDEDGQSIEIEWLGKNSKTMFVLCTNSASGGKVQYPSSLWRSINGGRYYMNDTKKLMKDVILSDHGMLKSPADPKRAILVGVPVAINPASRILITTDAGVTWKKTRLPFALEKIVFHPKRANLLLASSRHSNVTHKQHLYLSQDFGFSWTKIIRDVYSYAWGSTGDKEETIYASYGHVIGTGKTLVRSNDLSGHWTVILKDMQHFLVSSKFVYASISRPGAPMRDLYVSERSGANHTWLKARIPFAFASGSYYVLDTHEGVAFVHADAVGRGRGNIYTSDTQGVNYALSLHGHVHYLGKTDFYAVKSMRATYITSISSGADPFDKLQSRITFNRGGQWHALRTTQCGVTPTVSSCTVHIHGPASIRKTTLHGVTGPLSVEHAHGLILAHGSLGEFADVNKADMYVTTDGGYVWNKVLTGVHRYVIADLGKLLVAVPLNLNGNTLLDTLYFSENYGQCWHSSTFSTTKWHFTGLLADPLSMGMSVTLWGYTPVDGIWQTVTMEFGDKVERKCNADDYETHLLHKDNQDDSDQKTRGCLLGFKEEVKIVKPNVWCQQGKKTASEVEVTQTPCPCVKSDFECDYGFVRIGGVCKRDSSVPKNHTLNMLCAKGVRKYRKSDGYRLVPGDTCSGGVDLGTWKWASCLGHDLDENLADVNQNPSKPKKKSYAGTVVIFLIAFVAFVGGIGYCFRRKGFCRPGGFQGRARYAPVPNRDLTDTEDDAEDDDDTLLDVSKGPKRTLPVAVAPAPAAELSGASGE